MWHAQRMRRIILSYLAFLVVPYSFTVSHNRYDFPLQKKVVELKMCFDFQYNYYLKHFSLKETVSEISYR